MTAAATTQAAATAGRGAVTAAALLSTFLQAVNISLPNSAVIHMQGAMSMGDDEVGWVFSAYIGASVIVMPLTRWLAGRYGRKTIYQLSLAVFALGLVLNTVATTSLQMVFARIVQGAGSGTLAPLSLAILLDVHPQARHARLGLLWTVTLVLGIVSGPPVGGWLSEYYGWRWIFFASLPVVGFIIMATALSLDEKKAPQNPPFDFFGWATFSLGITGLQMLLDRGERLEWFASREIWAEAAAAALGFYLFAVHVATSKAHFLAKQLFRDRNYVLSASMFFGFGFVLLPTLALTSPMLAEVLEYPVDTAGYMTIPRGIALVAALVLASLASGRADDRVLTILGVALVAYANWRMLGYSPAMDWRAVATAGVLQGAGLGLMMPALTRLAFGTLDQSLRPEGTALFNLSRLYGSTIGIAVVQILFHRGAQTMHASLAEKLTPFRAAGPAMQAIAGRDLALLNEMVMRQAAIVAFINQFKILLIAILVVSPLVLLLRTPRPAK